MKLERQTSNTEKIFVKTIEIKTYGELLHMYARRNSELDNTLFRLTYSYHKTIY